MITIPKTIQELKKEILLSKKEDVQVSKAYASILKQVESATIGVKNPETDETKLILAGAKKELKEQEQSKAAGAPISEKTIEVCSEVVIKLSPKTLSVQETENAVLSIIEIDNVERKMGSVMSAMKAKYGSDLDMKILSDAVKKILA